MSSSGGVFSQTLQSITDTKLAELSKKRNYFEDQKSALLKEVHADTDQRQRLRLLLNGVKESFQAQAKTAKRKRDDHLGAKSSRITGTGNPRLEVLLNNLQKFLDQARYDPSISPKLLTDWEESLTKELDIQSLKYQYATLYGQLVTEWLSTEKAAKPSDEKDVEQMEDFEKVDWKEKDEARANWEEIVFQPFEVDAMAVGSYLNELFGKNGTEKKVLGALDKLREEVEAFEITLASPRQFNNSVLRWTINGLLSSDLLDDEKRAVLKDFLSNPIILVEVADVLNMRMASLKTWSWEDHVSLEMRRKVNGDSQIYMHEDLLQAIFLQFVGVKWSVFLKSAFRRFSDIPGAWTSNSAEIPENDIKWREYFLGSLGITRGPSVQTERQKLYKSRYFMAQLMNEEQQQLSGADGEVEANYEAQVAQSRGPMMPWQQQMQTQQYSAATTNLPMQTARRSTGGMAPRMQLASKASRRAPKAEEIVEDEEDEEGEYDDEDEYEDEDEDEYEDCKPTSPMQTKQRLLHLLSAEIILNTEFHDELTCLHSEFQSWLPTLPHSTIISVLTFLGVSQKWLGFFKTFLEAPLRFIEDGPSGQVKKRKRGVPSSHVLSDVFGEVILFCMDYSVNESTGGTRLYRMHDDFWIWSTSHEKIITAWNTISQFASTMGLSPNPSKTGTVRILKDKTSPATIDPSLPVGEIRWGFLYLDSTTGRFLIDQKMVDKHIQELQKQLQGKTSIFSYIQAWNTYAGTFFTSNFGKPAHCFGREHVDMMLSTLSRIQKCIFPSTIPGNINSIATHLKATIASRYGITDIPDGYLYFTTPLGGLELHNPFIGLLQLRDSVWENPETAFSNFYEAEEEQYKTAKLQFERRRNTPNMMQRQTPLHPLPHEFFSLAEFSKYREEFRFNQFPGALGTESIGAGNLHGIFSKLLRVPREESVSPDSRMLDALKGLGVEKGEIRREWRGMGRYWRWVVMIYGGEMVERFGGLRAVDKGVLPVGMVGLVRGGRVKWE